MVVYKRTRTRTVRHGLHCSSLRQDQNVPGLVFPSPVPTITNVGNINGEYDRQSATLLLVQAAETKLDPCIAVRSLSPEETTAPGDVRFDLIRFDHRPPILWSELQRSIV
jgi:hypothetical protein